MAGRLITSSCSLSVSRSLSSFMSICLFFLSAYLLLNIQTLFFSASSLETLRKPLRRIHSYRTYCWMISLRRPYMNVRSVSAIQQLKPPMRQFSEKCPHTKLDKNTFWWNVCQCYFVRTDTHLVLFSLFLFFLFVSYFSSSRL